MEAKCSPLSSSFHFSYIHINDSFHQKGSNAVCIRLVDERQDTTYKNNHYFGLVPQPSRLFSSHLRFSTEIRVRLKTVLLALYTSLKDWTDPNQDFESSIRTHPFSPGPSELRILYDHEVHGFSRRTSRDVASDICTVQNDIRVATE